jgi:hypothetical protein
MSFIWRTGVTSTTPPGLSDTGLLVIRIVMTVVLGIGVLYGFLIMTTFQRYGVVMDKAWKQRIDKWIEEKATGNKDSYHSYSRPAMDDLRYRPSHHRSYPDRSEMYRPYSPRLHHQPSFGDVNGRYPRHTYAPPHNFVPSPRMGSPYSSRSESPTSSIYRSRRKPPTTQPTIIPIPPSHVNTFPNHSSDFRDHGGTTSATHNSNRSPPPSPVAFTEDFLRHRLSPIFETSLDGDNALGFSSGLETKSVRVGGDDALDDGNRVRFRLPSGSSKISNPASSPGPMGELNNIRGKIRWLS